MKRIVIGTRGSELARTQSEWVAAQLRDAAPDTEIVLEIIKTTGDRIQDVALSKIGGKGLFTKELEVALLEGRIDLAVHSLKDLPTELPPGLALGAVPVREVPWDALVARDGLTLAQLPAGARVGTSSLRRCAQLRACRKDLDIVDLRGNVPTRLAKVAEGALDAVVLAHAGLKRLGLHGAITEDLGPETMVPAPAQGALGIEIREDDGELRSLLAAIHDEATALCANAERAVLTALGGGCQVPIGAMARLEDGRLHLIACVADPDSGRVIRTALDAFPSEAAKAGLIAAETLLAEGAAEIIARVTGFDPALPLKKRRIVVTRAAAQAADFVHRLEALGATVFILPTIEVKTKDDVPFAGSVCAADWLVFTSRNAVMRFRDVLAREGRDIAIFRASKICVVGPGTAKAVAELGLPIALQAETQVGEGVFEALRAHVDTLKGKHVLLPRGDKARPYLRDALRDAGAQVTDLVVYETSAAEVTDAKLEALEIFAPDVVAFTSSSTCAHFCERLGSERLSALKCRTVFASIGPKTTETALAYGLGIAIEPRRYDVPALVEAITAWSTRQA